MALLKMADFCRPNGVRLSSFRIEEAAGSADRYFNSPKPAPLICAGRERSLHRKPNGAARKEKEKPKRPG